MEERRIKKLEEKEEARRAAQQAREEAGEDNEQDEEQQQQHDEEQPEEEEEDDPDAPKLDEMIQERKEKLQQQREADLAKIEDYAEQFKAIQVPVIIIDADRNIESVFKNICKIIIFITTIDHCKKGSELKQNLENRSNLIEKHLIYKIEEEKISNYEKSYVYKKSMFSKFNYIYLLLIIVMETTMHQTQAYCQYKKNSQHITESAFIILKTRMKEQLQ